VLRVSGKTGEGVPSCSTRSSWRCRALGRSQAPARALIFDSAYDSYRGIVTYIRMVDGKLASRERLQMMGIGMPMSRSRSA
jgi:GTP-binding protein LepA